MGGEERVWSLLIHSLPPRPPYLRAKIRNRLRLAGAVALKDSVYVLPGDAPSREKFREVAAEAVAGGGEAWVCEARFEDAATDALLLRRLDDRGERLGRIWTTRRAIQIDRIASAWLIRRFIDARARFRFVDAKEPRRAGEVTFDMVDADYTHEDDRCTFETLVARREIADHGVLEIAEIVHDIDIKDGKFGRADAPGVQQMILGIVLNSGDDEERLRRGFALFDDLYASFRSRNPVSREVNS